MRKITVHRKKNFLGKWLDYYLIIDIPQNELAEYTGVKKFAMGFDEGLVKSNNQFFKIANGETVIFEIPESESIIYAVYFDSAGIRFGPELSIVAGRDDLSLECVTKMGLSANKVVLTLT